MSSNPIPAIDPNPLPGPPWLFHVLWVVTFLVHLLLVNSVLGGSLLAAFARGDKPGRRSTVELFTNLNSWTISLAITFGIAPLLFMQVLYGRFFYSATVLVGNAWIGMLVILMIAYYSNYVAKFRLRKGKNGGIWPVVVAACFVVIAAIQVTINLLHMQPERWEQVAIEPWTALADPAFIPRFLHFVLGALVMAGALLAWVAIRRAKGGGGGQDAAAMARFGIRTVLAATVLQLVDGIWLLLSLPRGMLGDVMRGGIWVMLPLTLGIVLAVVMLIVLTRLGDPIGNANKVRRVMELVVGISVFMVLTRHQLRDFYLAIQRSNEKMIVAPQWGVFAMFLAVFIGCVALTVYAAVKARMDTTDSTKS